MLQNRDGRQVFVVDFSGWPKDLPIPWETEEERPYAVAFTSAAKAGIIKSPGKYEVYVTIDFDDTLVYNVRPIVE